jgi:hypothetical protein
MHDTSNKQLIPVFELITTDHTSMNLSSMFLLAKKALENSSNSFKMPSVIVTDQGPAIINSSFEIFVGLTIQEYLKISFDLITKNKVTRTIDTALFYCAFHILKNMKEKAKDVRPALDRRVTKAFLFCFTILQNSRTLEHFITYLKHIYIFFCSEYFTPMFVRSFHQIKNKISERNNVIYVDRPTVGGPTTKETDDKRDKEISKKIKSGSPFKAYFDELKRKFESELNNHIKLTAGENLEPNFFYCPVLYEKIHNLLCLLPFWSGILISKLDLKSNLACSNPGDNCLSRFTNNPVESYFKIIKNHYFRNEYQMPSQISSILYQRLISKYFIHYKLVKVSFDREGNESIKDKQGIAKETWQSNSQKRKRGVAGSKGFYYKDSSEFPSFENNNNENNISYHIYDNIEYMSDVFELSHLMEKNATIDKKESFYFLKLVGSNNSCYSNAVLQAFLNLGKEFLQHV